MSQTSIFCTAAIVCALPFQIAGQSAAQGDCQLAERYYELAKDQLAAYKETDAALYLERANIACPRYTYAQELGELRMTSVDENERRRAVDAFIASHSLASSDQERARALWKYAALLNQEGDPQNADRLIREAKRLDSSNAEIVALAGDIEMQIKNPTREQLVRGLANSLYKPLMMAAVASSPGAVAPSAGARADAGGSVRIAINFDFDSVQVDDKTAANLDELAQALVDPQFSGRKFVFVGHSDSRGEAPHNMELSRQRAASVAEDVIRREPTLSGRISTTGRGEAEPIESGDTEDAHWANRRLQVIVQ